MWTFVVIAVLTILAAALGVALRHAERRADVATGKATGWSQSAGEWRRRYYDTYRELKMERAEHMGLVRAMLVQKGAVAPSVLDPATAELRQPASRTEADRLVVEERRRRELQAIPAGYEAVVMDEREIPPPHRITAAPADDDEDADGV